MLIGVSTGTLDERARSGVVTGPVRLWYPRGAMQNKAQVSLMDESIVHRFAYL